MGQHIKIGGTNFRATLSYGTIDAAFGLAGDYNYNIGVVYK